MFWGPYDVGRGVSLVPAAVGKQSKAPLSPDETISVLKRLSGGPRTELSKSFRTSNPREKTQRTLSCVRAGPQAWARQLRGVRRAGTRAVSRGGTGSGSGRERSLFRVRTGCLSATGRGHEEADAIRNGERMRLCP